MPIGLIDAPIVRHAQIQCLGLGTASEKNGMVLSPFQEITMFSNHLFNQNRKMVSFQAKKKKNVKIELVLDFRCLMMQMYERGGGFFLK